jgi:ParB family transcriptional regulator, chromosome partitioning protein
MDFSALENVEEIEIINPNETNVIDLQKLTPNPYQPRLKDTDVTQLAQSIKEHGQLQPIIINQDNVIVGGHRRYYSHLQLGLKTIKYTRVKTTKQELYSFSIVENEERQSLSFIELALSYKKALDENLFENAKDLAVSLNKSESQITKVRNMLKLPNEIQDDIIQNKRKLSVETLSALLQIKEKSQILDLYNQYIKGLIDRNDILDAVKISKQKPKREILKISKTSFKMDMKISHLDEDKKLELEEEIRKLINKYEE